MNVSAKDLGTGKSQQISITASTNMSKDDIDRAVREAEQFAEEDKKRKEQVDAKNNGESLCFQCEKALSEFGDKVSAEDKAPIEAAVNDLKEALKGENYEDIKAKTEALQNAFYALSSKVYQQANPNGAPDMSNMGDMGNMGGGADDNGFVDADFTEA